MSLRRAKAASVGDSNFGADRLGLVLKAGLRLKEETEPDKNPAETGVTIPGKDNIDGALKIQRLGLNINPGMAVDLNSPSRPTGILPDGREKALRPGGHYRLNVPPRSPGVYATLGDAPNGHMVGLINPESDYYGLDQYAQFLTWLMGYRLEQEKKVPGNWSHVLYTQPLNTDSPYGKAAELLFQTMYRELREASQRGGSANFSLPEERTFHNVWLFYKSSNYPDATPTPGTGIYLCLGRFRVANYFTNGVPRLMLTPVSAVPQRQKYLQLLAQSDPSHQEEQEALAQLERNQSYIDLKLVFENAKKLLHTRTKKSTDKATDGSSMPQPVNPAVKHLDEFMADIYVRYENRQRF